MSAIDFDNVLTSVERKLKQVDPGAVLRLQHVVETLHSSSPADLAGIDLRSVLDPDRIEARAAIVYQGRPESLNFLEWVRNVIVLLPIALTWFELSVATTRYNALISLQGGRITEPFLLLWERNFYEPSSGWINTFSDLAFWDAIIIVCIIAISIIVHFQRDVLAAKAEARATQLREEIEMLLWQLSRKRSLAVSHQDLVAATSNLRLGIDQFQTSAHEMLELMRWERERLTDLGNGNLTVLESIGDRVVAGASDIVRYGQSVESSYSQTRTSIDGLAQAVAATFQQQQRAVQSLNFIGNQTSALLDATRANTAGLEIASARFMDVAQRSAAGAHEVAEAVGEIRHELQQFAASLKTDQDQMASSLTDAVGRLSGVGMNLEHLAGNIDAFVEHADQTRATLSQAVGSLEIQTNAAQIFGTEMVDMARTFSGLIDQQITESRTLLTGVSNIVTDLQQTLNGMTETIRQTTTTLAQSAQDQREMITSVAQAWKASETNLNSVQQMSERLEQASERLQQAVALLDRRQPQGGNANAMPASAAAISRQMVVTIGIAAGASAGFVMALSRWLLG